MRKGDNGSTLVRAPAAGTIHQAEAAPGSHSLHLTVSACQRLTLADLLETALPRALALAAEECAFMRETLPPAVFSCLVREAPRIHWPACTSGAARGPVS